MAAPVFDFPAARNLFCNCVQQGVDGNSLVEIEHGFKKADCNDNEKKTALDQAFRDVLKNLIVQDQPYVTYTTLISLAVNAATHEFCTPLTPFLLLSDVFDSVTLSKCEDLFYHVENEVMVWKSDMFYTVGKNYLLRMCNDLLRRLSKSQNTVFCGRIQLFLAKLFPLSEPSGLNLMSQFHLDNITDFNKKADEYMKSRQSIDADKEENMDIEEGEMDDLSSSIPIDYNLYRKFWSLQDYFRKPTQCYEKLQWKQFTNFSDDVFNVFLSFKLDDLKASKKKLDRKQSESRSYFAKYLTSEKLLDLQLADSNFRRYVLIQFLILFQYLNASVRFKTNNFILTDEQSQWVKDATERVYQLLRETPPDGSKFAQVIEQVLEREEHWNNWKNEGCPSFVKAKQPDSEVKVRPQRLRKRSVGEDFRVNDKKLIKMGNSEMTRLWNISHDNLEACRAKDKVFLPTLEQFFEEAIEQADPEAGIEEQYKLVNNKNFCWRALRILVKKSPHFFTQTNQPGLKMDKYLDMMIKKIAKPKPAGGSQDDMKTDIGDNEEEDMKESNQEEDLQGEEQPEAKEPSELPVTSTQIQDLAEKVGSDWKTLATELNFSEEDIAGFESSSEDIAAQCVIMLTKWQETEGERATMGTLRTGLKEVGLLKLAIEVFGENKDPEQQT